MSHFESLVAVSSVITFIFSMIEFVPSTLYFLSGFSLTCLLTQVVFPEPGNPTIMITYNNASSTTITQARTAIHYAIMCICANKCSMLQSSLTTEMHLRSLSNIQRLSYCSYLTFLLSCRPSCAVYQRLFTNWLNEGVPFICWEPWLFLHNTKKLCYIFTWPKWFYAL